MLAARKLIGDDDRREPIGGDEENVVEPIGGQGNPGGPSVRGGVDEREA